MSSEPHMPHPHPHPHPHQGCAWYAQLAGVVSIIIGLTVLAGWTFGYPALTSLISGMVAMKINTAASLVAIGGSLVVLTRYRGRWSAVIGSALAIFAAAVGFATLLEHILRLDLGIDNLIIREAEGTFGTLAPGRMAPTTAICFCLIAMALVTLHRPVHRRFQPAQYLALAALLISFPTFLAYLYGITAFPGLAYYTQMAIHTAFGLSVVATGILAARTDRLVIGVLSGQWVGSRMARHLLWSATLSPIAIGGLMILSIRYELLPSNLALALTVTLNIMVFLLTIWFTARRVNVLDQDRVRAETELRESAAHLEERVKSRTVDLETVNAQLMAQTLLRDQALESLRENEERFRSVVSSANEAIVIADERGIIASWNQGAQRMFGYRETEMLGRSLTCVMPERYRAAHQAGIERLARTGQATLVGKTVQLEGLRSNSEEFPLELSLATWTSAKGRFFSGTMIDITERISAVRTIIEAKESAEATSRAKSEFVANVSHEIRTPMNGIIGMTSLLLDSQLTREQRGYAQDVRSSAEHLMGIINSILDFSKLDAGRAELESMPFGVRDLVEEISSVLNDQADRKQIALTCVIEPGVPDQVVGDAAKLRQVLDNLLGNAIKFTSVGEVGITVSLDGPLSSPLESDSSIARLHFSIVDTGIGIDADGHARLFQPFSQGDSSTKRRYGGTGLGLVISQRLVAAMGGRLIVDSTPGVGSTFSFTLPMKGADEHTGFSQPANMLPPSVRETRVLCVDDNPRRLRSLQIHLKRFGLDPTTADSAAYAMVKARDAVASGRPFQAFFIDSRITPMLGPTLARSLALVGSQSIAKVVLVTNSPAAVARQSDSASSTHMYLQAPFRSHLVQHCLKTMLAVDSKESTEEPQAGPKVPSRQKFLGVRALVAEDNSINQRLVQHLLAKFGIESVVVGNGIEAVEAVRLAPYDVIFMDCQMPDMDGFQATAHIRAAGGAGQRTPIVAITANALPADRERCLAAGMDHYLSKPLSESALADVLRLCLRGRTDTGPSAPGESPLTVTSDAAAPPSAEPAIDRAVLRLLAESLPDGDAVVAELIHLFKQDTPEQLRKMMAAVEGGDGLSLARAAHRMKSGCRTLGLKDMEAICLLLERAGHAGILQGVIADCQRLSNAYDHVIKEL